MAYKICHDRSPESLYSSKPNTYVIFTWLVHLLPTVTYYFDSRLQSLLSRQNFPWHSSVIRGKQIIKFQNKPLLLRHELFPNRYSQTYQKTKIFSLKLPLNGQLTQWKKEITQKLTDTKLAKEFQRCYGSLTCLKNPITDSCSKADSPVYSFTNYLRFALILSSSQSPGLPSDPFLQAFLPAC
jgi:hypothetical protein